MRLWINLIISISNAHTLPVIMAGTNILFAIKMLIAIALINNIVP